MTYNLSFSKHFFHGPGEPGEGRALNSAGAPVSLYSAIALEVTRLTQDDAEGLAELAALAGSALRQRIS